MGFDEPGMRQVRLRGPDGGVESFDMPDLQDHPLSRRQAKQLIGFR